MNSNHGARELAWIRSRLAAPLPIDAETAVIATSLQGQVAFWSKGAERLYGWSADEGVGRDIMELTPAPQSQQDAARIMEALQAGDSWRGEIDLRRRDGSEMRAYVLDIPVGDWSSRQGAIVGVSAPTEARGRVERRAWVIEAAVRARFQA